MLRIGDDATVGNLLLDELRFPDGTAQTTSASTTTPRLGDANSTLPGVFFLTTSGGDQNSWGEPRQVPVSNIPTTIGKVLKSTGADAEWADESVSLSANNTFTGINTFTGLVGTSHSRTYTVTKVSSNVAGTVVPFFSIERPADNMALVFECLVTTMRGNSGSMHKSVHSWRKVGIELFPGAITVLAEHQDAGTSTTFYPTIVEQPQNTELDIGVNCITNDVVRYVFELKITCASASIDGLIVHLR